MWRAAAAAKKMEWIINEILIIIQHNSCELHIKSCLVCFSLSFYVPHTEALIMRIFFFSSFLLLLIKHTASLVFRLWCSLNCWAAHKNRKFFPSLCLPFPSLSCMYVVNETDRNKKHKHNTQFSFMYVVLSSFSQLILIVHLLLLVHANYNHKEREIPHTHRNHHKWGGGGGGNATRFLPFPSPITFF